MPVLFDYLIKLNICFGVVYFFYQLFLRRLTFYNWNRWYLLGYSVLSFLMPLIDVMPSLKEKNLQEAVVMQWIPAISFEPVQEKNFLQTLSYWDWAIGLLILGSVILLIRFAIRFLAFQRMKLSAQLISDGKTKIYQLADEVSPFSFGNAIFINTQLHEGEELEEIIRHEFVHVKQRHTLDIIWFELLCILNWFNPFVWLLRHNVRQNLEFIADNKVLQNGLGRKEYQYLLLKVMGNRQFAFTNHFNFSSLKKRIAMMNSVKSAKAHLIKFMFLLPVIAVLLLSFRKEMIKTLEEKPFQKEGTKFGNQAVVTQENKGLVVPVEVIEKPIINLKDTTPSRKNPGENILLGTKNNNPNAPKPLIIIDGEEKEKSFNLNSIDPSSIISIDVLKDNAATTLYGEKAANGVIRISTTASKDKEMVVVGLAKNKNSVENIGEKVIEVEGRPINATDIKNRSNNNKGVTNIREKIVVVEGMPMNAANSRNLAGNKSGVVNYEDKVIIVDGKPIPEADSYEISPSDIATISVMKGNSKSNANGGKVLIVITTKDGKISMKKEKGLEVIVDTVYYEPNGGNRINNSNQKMNGAVKEVEVVGYSPKEKYLKNKNSFSSETYYVLDGEPVSKRKVDRLSPDEISSVKVLSKTEAPKYYGKKAADGAVIITTK